MPRPTVALERAHPRALAVALVPRASTASARRCSCTPRWRSPVQTSGSERPSSACHSSGGRSSIATTMPTWLTGLFVTARIARSASERPRNSQMSPVAAVATASSSGQRPRGRSRRVTVRVDARPLEARRPRRGRRRRRRPASSSPGGAAPSATTTRTSSASACTAAWRRPRRAAGAGAGRAGAAEPGEAAGRPGLDCDVGARGDPHRSRTHAGRRTGHREGEMRPHHHPTAAARRPARARGHPRDGRRRQRERRDDARRRRRPRASPTCCPPPRRPAPTTSPAGRAPPTRAGRARPRHVREHDRQLADGLAADQGRRLLRLRARLRQPRHRRHPDLRRPSCSASSTPSSARPARRRSRSSATRRAA